MKKGSTIILRAAVWGLGLIVLALCLLVLPSGVISDSTGLYRPLLIAMYLPAIPFFIALYHAIRLLDYIDKNQAFSEKSAESLKHIKYCAIAICGMYAAGMPYIFYVAELDDAPGAVLIGLTIIFASFAVATFSAVLQKLLLTALDYKEENELTV